MRKLWDKFRKLKRFTQAYWCMVIIAAICLVVWGSLTLLGITNAKKVTAKVPPGACPTKITLSSLRCEVNAIRRANGLPSLRVNQALRLAARRHARDMSDHHFFSHIGSHGDTLQSRARAAGYMRGYRRWILGENIAFGTGPQGSPRAIVNQWMASPPHRAILMNKSFKEGGAGIIYGTPTGGGGYTYVLDLGRRG